MPTGIPNKKKNANYHIKCPDCGELVYKSYWKRHRQKHLVTGELPQGQAWAPAPDKQLASMRAELEKMGNKLFRQQTQNEALRNVVNAQSIAIQALVKEE